MALARPRDIILAAEALPMRRQRSLWLDAWLRLRKNKMALAGLGVIGFFAGLALLAPWIAPHDPTTVYFGQSWGPYWISGNQSFLLGTDPIGRDELSRLIWGARVSMTVGLLPQFIILVLGGTIGLVAGYAGGRLDNLLMRITDVVYAFPDLLFLIILAATFRDTAFGQLGSGLPLIFTAIAIVGWVGMARLVRGQVLSLKNREFVEAARCLGASHFRIISRHLLPNSMAPVIVSLTFGIPGAIMAEATLSFIGIGLRPPTPSWGTMINEGFARIFSSPILVVAPATCIALVMLAFTFVGDGLRDALDPWMKK